MADNVNIPSSGSVPVAADDIGGVLHTRVKVQHGADGSATDVSTASPLPVSDAGGSLTVDGTVTADTELPAAAALSDALANPTTPQIGADCMLWDPGASVWKREQAASQLAQLLTVVGGTSTQTSSTQTNVSCRGVLFRVGVTSAGTGTLTPSILVLAPSAASLISFATFTTTGTRLYLLYPTTPSTTSALAAAVSGSFDIVNFPLPYQWSFRVTHSDASAWSYTVDAQILP